MQTAEKLRREKWVKEKSQQIKVSYLAFFILGALTLTLF